MEPYLHPQTFAGLALSEVKLFESILKDVEGEGVEIGCLDGFSTSVILRSSRMHLTSIDPLISDSMEASLRGDEQRLAHNVKLWRSRWTFLKERAEKVSQTWSRPIDFLFIDGDHAYDAVLQDFNQWTPWLKTGGILAIHDSRMGRPGGPGFHVGPSRVAAEKIFENSAWKVIGEAFSLTVCEKR